MKKFLITFRPIEPYFFGSEQTFGEGVEANYFAKSLMIPQQTTILGALREQILIQSEKWNRNGEYQGNNVQEVESLIGSKGFRFTNDPIEYGVLKEISPVFLKKGEVFYNFAPLDFNYKVDFENTKCSFSEKLPIVKIKNNSEYDIFSFDMKEGFKSSEIFIPYEKVGIDKPKYGETSEDRFYKKESYLIKGDFVFAAIVQVDFDLKDNIVFMGADNTKFEMKVQETTLEYKEIFKEFYSKNLNTITLLSEAIVDEDILDKCYFAINRTTNFRYIKTSTSNYRYDKNKSKSKLYNILTRGSVLFPRDFDSVKKMLDNSNLQKIGLNIYLEYKN